MRTAAILAFLAAAAVGGEAASMPDAQAVEMSSRLWRDGAQATFPGAAAADPEAAPDGEVVVHLRGGRDTDREPFTGLDARAARFVAGWGLKPAVQFSCASTAAPFEGALERALDGDDAGLRLQALTALVRAQAPASVDRQWRALTALRAPPDAPAVLTAIAGCFAPERFQAALAQPSIAEQVPGEALEPLLDRIRRRSERQWCIRAAGVTGCAELLDRLVELSRGEDLDDSLAAEASIEEFEGPLGDRALVGCLHGWRYNAAERAGNALLKRDRALLAAELEGDAAVPERYRYQQARLLAACDDPAAVPLLCATVGGIQIVDGGMLAAIARLARAEHRDLVEALPDHVRPDQRVAAERVRDAVRARLAAPAP